MEKTVPTVQKRSILLHILITLPVYWFIYVYVSIWVAEKKRNMSHSGISSVFVYGLRNRWIKIKYSNCKFLLNSTCTVYKCDRLFVVSPCCPAEGEFTYLLMSCWSISKLRNTLYNGAGIATMWGSTLGALRYMIWVAFKLETNCIRLFDNVTLLFYTQKRNGFWYFCLFLFLNFQPTTVVPSWFLAQGHHCLDNDMLT